jgi:hypothetical protein
MTECKVVGRRRTQLLDDLRNRRYWEVKEEAEDRKRWKPQFINRTYFFITVIWLVSRVPQTCWLYIPEKPLLKLFMMLGWYRSHTRTHTHSVRKLPEKMEHGIGEREETSESRKLDNLMSENRSENIA